MNSQFSGLNEATPLATPPPSVLAQNGTQSEAGRQGSRLSGESKNGGRGLGAWSVLSKNFSMKMNFKD